MTNRIQRRAFLRHGVAIASAASILPASAWAQSGGYPNRPIKILIGTPPGDTADGWTRQLAQAMQATLGQPVIVDNKPGAHGMIVGSAAKAAAPDGYTLLVSTGGPMSINPSVYKEKLTYDPLKDFVPIAPVLRGSLLPQVRAGRVRVIAVTSPQRDPEMPNVPTLVEQGVPGFEARVWMGLFAPAETPGDVIAKVHEATVKAASTAEFAAKLTQSASTPWLGSGDDLKKFLVADIQRWVVIVKEARVKAD